MEGDLAVLLKTTSTAVSVMTSDDPEVVNQIQFAEYIQQLGGAPTFPNQDPTHPFWEEFGEVVQARRTAARGST